MSEPTEAVYEAAIDLLSRKADIDGVAWMVPTDLLRELLAAVQPLAFAAGVAEGRRQAAADIRAHSPTGERAARIAEGTAGPVIFTHPCGWSQVSPIPHLCPQCGTAEPWS